MRFFYKRFVITIYVFTILFSLSTLIWKVFSSQYLLKYSQTCNQVEQYQEDLHEFTENVHGILRDLNLTHFLCYGSLWGQIRLSRLLPWEDKSVMCLLNEDFTDKDFVAILKQFKKNDLHITYHMTQGQYVVTRLNGDKKMKILLILFELDKVINMYRRIGWFRRLLPPSCESFEILDCFPPSLITPPLPMKEFGANLIPVPREGIELQKYHYKDDWWKEIPVKNC